MFETLCHIAHAISMGNFCFCASTSQICNPISPLYNPQSKNIGNGYLLPGHYKKENFHTCQYVHTVDLM